MFDIQHIFSPVSGRLADMIANAASRVVAVEKLSGGVVVTFDDGIHALLSARLLRYALEHAGDMKITPTIPDKPRPSA